MEEEIKKEKSTEFWVKVIIFGSAVFFWIVLIGLKLGSDYSLKVPFYVSLVLTILFIVSLFWKKFNALYEKIREHEEEIQPLTEEEVEAIEKKEINRIWNYIEKGIPVKRKSENVNNSMIYVSHLQVYREINFGEDKTNKIIIIINATFPKLRPTMIPEDTDPIELIEIINKMSKNPYNPDVEETKIETDTFGKPIQTTKRTSYGRKEEKKEDAVV